MKSFIIFSLTFVGAIMIPIYFHILWLNLVALGALIFSTIYLISDS